MGACTGECMSVYVGGRAVWSENVWMCASVDRRIMAGCRRSKWMDGWMAKHVGVRVREDAERHGWLQGFRQKC